jgi:homocysteine S-methyltransferase
VISPAMIFRSNNPIADFIKHRRILVLDGGLATALEAHGCDLNDDLWSARVLIEAPGTIRQVHLDFLHAGADCITTASYQASLAGFQRRGLSDDEGKALLARSVDVATEARDAFWADPANRAGRRRPLVAASIGPYGACLADGSEYTGSYDIDGGGLHDFHRGRWQMLAASDADLLACETIPSRPETEVLLRLLDETPHVWAWMSFSCRDGKRISDGTPLVEVVRFCDTVPRVAAVGVNCTAPRFIASLIAEARSGTGKPIIVYPNSGERYDVASRSWTAGGAQPDWATLSQEWAALGATCIGGCCRVGPSEITEIRRVLDTPIEP